jgi:hypothetical protein
VETLDRSLLGWQDSLVFLESTAGSLEIVLPVWGHPDDGGIVLLYLD